MSNRFPPQPESTPLLAVLAAVNRRALVERFPAWQPTQRHSPPDAGDASTRD